MAFANQYAFDDRRSYQMATGVDLNVRTAINDPSGNVLAYAQTGGMISPQRFELRTGSKIFRFVGKGTPQQAATGSWWVEQSQFEKLLAFANVHGLSIGMAMRILCLVPPEWNDATLLVRARAVRDFLAFRGLGNSVITPAAHRGGIVSMPHQNEIAARRLFQLFIPGLRDVPHNTLLSVEADYPLSAAASKAGFIYL